MYFDTRKDLLYSILIWGTILFIGASIVLPFFFVLGIGNFIWGIIGMLLIGFFLWLWFGTGYYVEEETIHIQHGPFKQTIDIRKILELPATYRPYGLIEVGDSWEQSVLIDVFFGQQRFLLFTKLSP